MTALTVNPDDPGGMKLHTHKDGTGPLPPGFTYYEIDGSIYLRYNGNEIVTEYSGKRRQFRGTDAKTLERAIKFAWQFHDILNGNSGGESSYRVTAKGDIWW